MPTVIQGFEILTKPASTELESFPILITIPQAAPGNLRVITFPTEFNAIAISLQIENQDATNAASYRLNSSTDPLVNLPSSNFRSFSQMNIVSVTVQPGAAGPTILSGQMAAMPKSKPLVGL
jgi:hypothetical protein|tara:strand:- start:330 stop:695 length:366 start_codon:yes stop_codon:yes gene_type:complete